jgi:dipeptidyl aminopeptidase/acylaminoacyl peptidase
MRALIARCAVVAMGWSLGCATADAKPFTVDRMLRDQAIGQVLIAPGGRRAILEQRLAYDRAATYAYGPFTSLMLSRVMVVDLARPGPVRPLFPQRPGAGYWAAGFSPSGRRLAVFRLSARRLQAGIVDMTTRRVRWLPLSPDQPGAALAPTWIDDRHLLIVALPAGTLPRYLDQTGFATRVAARDARIMASGKISPMSSLRSGPASDSGVPRRLLSIDVVTGRQRSLGEGDIADVALSADRRYLAVIRFGAALQPIAGAPLDTAYQDRARRLSLVELASGRETGLSRDLDVAPDLLAWSPAGHRLLFYARSPDSGWEDGAFLSSAGGPAAPLALPASVRPVVERPQQISPVIHAAWMGAAPIVYAGQGGRSDWYRLGDAGGGRALTRSLAATPSAIVAADAGALIVRTGDDLWRIDRAGIAANLASGVVSVGSETRDPYQRGSRAWYNGVPDEAGAIGLSAGAGGPMRRDRVALAADERLLAYSAEYRVAIIVARDPSGAARVFARREDGGRVKLIEINRHLAGVDRARSVPVAGLDEAERPVVHWLLLPLSGRAKPPLIVIPYPGMTFSAATSPAPSPAEVMSTVNGELLAAHGFAVLYPSLALGYDVRTPLTAIAKGIDRAIGDATATGRVDPDRVAIWGHSYGGYAALCAAVAGKRSYRAIIASAGISDLAAGYGALDPQLDRAANGMFLFGPAGFFEGGQGRMGAPPWQVPDRYLANSPFFHADAVRAPLLLIHGTADFVPVAQAERMFVALFRLRREAELLRYPGEWHSLVSPADIRDQWRRVFAWLDEHLR